jgi:hypothetical protein
MPDTKELKRKADNQESEESPSSIIKPDDPIMKEYEKSKRRLQEAAKNISLAEEDRDATVSALRTFAQKKQSSKIIKR